MPHPQWATCAGKLLQPPAKWKGTARRNALWRALCPGPRLRRHGLPGQRPQRGLPLSERLHARQRQSSSKLPVMFWIHGGGYSGGVSLRAAPQRRLPAHQGRRPRHHQLPPRRLRLSGHRPSWPKKPTAQQGTTACWTWWPRSTGSTPTSQSSAAIPATSPSSARAPAPLRSAR